MPWVILAAVIAMPHVCDYTWSPELDAIILQEAQRAGTPLDLAYTFIAAESSFDPTSHVVSEIEDSVGLLQLNRKGGQGQGYSVQELMDPRRNLQIGLPYITAAFRATWSPTIPPYDFIYLVATRSGHPGPLPRDHDTIRRIARIWSCFFPAAGTFGPGGAPSESSGMAGGPSLAGAMALPLLLTMFPAGIFRWLLPSISPIATFQGKLSNLTPGGFQRRLEYMMSPKSMLPGAGLLQLARPTVRLPPRHRFPRQIVGGGR
jgi:hypothetical protein